MHTLWDTHHTQNVGFKIIRNLSKNSWISLPSAHVDFDEIKKNVSVHFDYEITSKRVIELLMFEADKRDNKKLI